MRWDHMHVDCRYFGPRRDSAWFVLRRRRSWRHWLRRLLGRTDG